MKIKPEKRKVLENLYVEILHDQNYYNGAQIGPQKHSLSLPRHPMWRSVISGPRPSVFSDFSNFDKTIIVLPKIDGIYKWCALH